MLPLIHCLSVYLPGLLHESQNEFMPAEWAFLQARRQLKAREEKEQAQREEERKEKEKDNEEEVETVAQGEMQREGRQELCQCNTLCLLCLTRGNQAAG